MGAGAGYSLEEILDFLNDTRRRATYGAVGDTIGVYHRNVSRLLGHRSPRCSWIVSKRTGRPSDYGSADMHTHLFYRRHVITDGAELRRRIDRWDKRRRRRMLREARSRRRRARR